MKGEPSSEPDHAEGILNSFRPWSLFDLSTLKPKQKKMDEQQLAFYAFREGPKIQHV